jgi:hypothetical protein
MDRGPYGALLPNGKWGIKSRRKDPGRWRGIIDLSPAMAKAIQLNGKERVRILYPTVPARTSAHRDLSKALSAI